MDQARFGGTLIKWNDERGFGFVRPDQDSNDQIFVHIKAFRGATRRPVIGDRITFSLSKQADGKVRAAQAQIGGAERKPESHVLEWVAASFCYAASVAISFLTGQYWLPVAYPAASVVTMIFYLGDKSSAQTGEWRVSEANLHFLELIGGWPGALLGQQVLRHKVSKVEYQGVFRLIIGLHSVAWVATLGYVLFGSEVGW